MTLMTPQGSGASMQVNENVGGGGWVVTRRRINTREKKMGWKYLAN